MKATALQEFFKTTYVEKTSRSNYIETVWKARPHSLRELYNPHYMPPR